MNSIDSLLASLSSESGRRGREFERICKWFLENSPIYQAELEHVWLWNDWPGRWGPDAGIDLVAKDRRGRLWAIQSKAYSETYSVTKGDVDTFLSESSREQFAFRLLIATTDRVGANARRTMEGQEKPASLLLLGDLRSQSVEWPESPESLLPATRVAKQPRPDQEIAIGNVVDGFGSVERGRLVMACGTGKTLVSLFTAERLAAQRILVLVPSLSLLAQTLDEWTSNSAAPIEFLPVCSDESVVDADSAESTTSDLGFPVTTDPVEIAEFLRATGERTRVVFSTYQSSPRIADAMKLGGVPDFDLVIADEAHRCAGRVSNDFATVLNGDLIRARRRLFMTATPRYFTGRVIREARETDFEVASMDDETVFGPLFHRFTFAQAIEQGLLTDYQVAIIGIDDATYREWAHNGLFVTTDGTEVTDARTLAAQIGLAKAIRMFDLRRTITFHSRVTAAHRFATELPSVIDWMPENERPAGTLGADYISGKMSAGERRRKLGQLRDLDTDRALISNARCLTEGIDVPTLDAVAFIDPRRSEVDIIQAVGRAIRRAPDKKIGTIVLPVFISNTDDPAIALDDSAFKPVWDVLNALRAHDEELAETLDELRRQLSHRPGLAVQLPRKIRIELPSRISVEFAKAMRIRLVEQATSTWEFWYGLLAAYVDREGHARVPDKYVESGNKLGTWLSNQRMRRARLDADQQARLQSLPRWTWDVLVEQWEENFAVLCVYVAREGDARVPDNHVEDGVNLGTWVGKQRSRRDQMDPAQKERLVGLPRWTWDPRGDRWEEMFALLCQYAEREMSSRVPDKYIEAGVNLGTWLGTQRTRRNRLTDEQTARLKALPDWTWDARLDPWEETFALLVGYVQREGTARVPQRHIEAGVNLGTWVNTQRRKRHLMDAGRRDHLQGLPHWSWNPRKDPWEEHFDALTTYVQRVGNARVPREHEEGDLRLGNWVKRQRSAIERLEPDQRTRLEALPEWTRVIQKPTD